jgi:hypothetical protein
MRSRGVRGTLRYTHLRRLAVESRTPVSWDEWQRIEKEQRREADRIRVFDLARRLRASAAVQSDQG